MENESSTAKLIESWRVLRDNAESTPSKIAEKDMDIQAGYKEAPPQSKHEVTITLDLNDPENEKILKRYLKSTDMALVIWEINHNLRKRCMEVTDDMEKDEAIDFTFDKIDDLLYEHGVVIDDLID